MALAEALHYTRDTIQVKLQHGKKFSQHFSRPGGLQPVPMTEEGEGVDHVKMTLTKEAMSRAAEKLNLGPEGEHTDHDGVKLRINAS